MQEVNDKLSIKNVEIDKNIYIYDKTLFFKISLYRYTYIHRLYLQSEIGIG